MGTGVSLLIAYACGALIVAFIVGWIGIVSDESDEQVVKVTLFVAFIWPAIVPVALLYCAFYEAPLALVRTIRAKLKSHSGAGLENGTYGRKIDQ